MHDGAIAGAPRRAGWRSPALIGAGGVLWLLIAVARTGSWTEWSAAMPLLGAALLGAVGLYLLPGLAVLRVLWPTGLSRAERVALALTTSVALPPLLLQAFSVLHLPWGAWSTWAMVAGAALVCLWPRRDQRLWTRLSGLTTWRLGWHGLALLVFVAISGLLRVFVVRDLAAPMWGDAVHHTLITQLIIDQQAVPTHWHPYAPLSSMSYHYGFHANAAFIHWLTGLSADHSVLLAGQLLNTWTLAAAYALTTRLGGSRLAGLWAVALVGFVNTQPIYFVNWSRFTQLAGQVALVPLLLAWLRAFEAPRWRALLLAAMLTAGIVLIHSIVAVWAAALVMLLALAILAVWPTLLQLRRVVVAGALGGGGGVLLALPWLLTLFNSRMWTKANRAVEKYTSVLNEPGYNLPELAPTFLKGSILLLAMAGLFWALARRQWRMALCGLWAGGMTLLVVPFVIGLPLSGIVTGFAYGLGMYVVMIPLAAFGLVALTAPAPWAGLIGRWLRILWLRPALLALHGLALLAVTLWSVGWQRQIIDPTYALVQPADLAAMDWIRTATPPDARFLITAVPAYGGRQFAGDDAGWWIPYFTGRQTVLPPLTYVTEQGDTPDLIEHVNGFFRALTATPLPSAAGIALLRQEGVRFIYLAQRLRPGHVPNDYQAMRYLPEVFKIVYERDGVVIFELRPES